MQWVPRFSPGLYECVEDVYEFFGGVSGDLVVSSALVPGSAASAAPGSVLCASFFPGIHMANLTTFDFGLFLAGLAFVAMSTGPFAAYLKDKTATAHSSCLAEPTDGKPPSGDEQALQEIPAAGATRPKEKYIFLIRHAESEWNEVTSSPSSFARVAHKTMLKTDHPLTARGVRQAHDLRNKIAAELSHGYGHRPEAERVFYEKLLDRRRPPRILCSPMQRALQTAFSVLPPQQGWGGIVLLKDAREKFRNFLERDNLSEVKGGDIAWRAVEACGLQHRLVERVDCTDCENEWWNCQPEAEEEFSRRLRCLVQHLLEDAPGGGDNCICVTHSNIIRELAMRYGAVEQAPVEADADASFCVYDCERGAMRGAKTEKIENCGMIGLKFVAEGEYWGIHEACLMFGSKMETDGKTPGDVAATRLGIARRFQ
mmetsp:Transcript_61653/g.173869  ORF Transcript_61653/g.173869 Transcript_61653/m.173869 type:complete len:428 (+) Transcript_61653:133-1416(+)|eukprot:CAMPEP_0179259752 /NCGR_PEP_ID=MMETSP0797-20121207/25982_1 /TAXON_ID=47934 /ORGANISM="Dinophysis acuminata, Strain DAEP01" /LENGTH=427 /DNA_ID=CAMNT_0020967803 /DNA_START=120 /DNA_END=1403 /DNA_ORIENTATION=+